MTHKPVGAPTAVDVSIGNEAPSMGWFQTGSGAGKIGGLDS